MQVKVIITPPEKALRNGSVAALIAVTLPLGFWAMRHEDQRHAIENAMEQALESALERVEQVAA